MNKQLLDMAFNSLIKGEENYIKTGSKILDSHLKTYGKGSVITISSQMDFVQSILFRNFCEEFLTQGKKCLYFSFNYPQDEIVKFLLLQNSKAKIKSDFCEPKTITKENLKKLENSRKIMSDWDLHICDKSSMCLAEFEDLIKRVKPDYVFIDSINNFNLDSITINYFVKKLKELAISKELTPDEFKIVNIAINKLLGINECALETDISSYDAMEILSKDIDFEIQRVFSNPVAKFNWNDISIDYIAENLKGIATRQNTIMFVNYFMEYLPEFWRVTDRKYTNNIKSESLKKNSDVVILLKEGVTRDEETETDFERKTEAEIVFYKGDVNIGGYNGLTFDCDTASFVDKYPDGL